MPTITKMTPEDLTAIGVKKPTHRKKLKADIVKLTIADGLPNYIPPTLDEFLHLVRLMEYRGLLANQGYLTIDDLTQISIEDLEDIGKGPLILLCQIISVECPTNFECMLVSCHLKLV